MTRVLLISLLLLSLSGCGKQIVRPAPIDWNVVQSHVETLAQPTQIEGPIQFRDQAEDGGDLWDLSLNQSLALEEANSDKRRIVEYVRGLADKAEKALAPAPSRWTLFRERFTRRSFNRQD